ncbi:MAG: alpha/beta hydrolase [Chloroflexi bacterium]|nr:MAG: lysophospholipase [Anaerolineaceae bacterium 4572_32.2]RLC76193.1 MAG: alpha/beta hydrolase [Chloroflexota bacterium]RLC83531.1 MAG: alpha/beta hydrolase [Chloroflexota bacterium]
MKHDEGTFDGYGGLELYYQRWRPEGEPKAILAIVHGLGEHSGRYGNVVDWFAPQGYAVYACDLRGFGRSPGPRGYINEWAEFREDVKAFLAFVREQEPGRPLFLLGHSMGGLIVLEYALHHPEGLAAVIASGPALAVDIPPILMLLSKVLSGILPRFTLDTGLDAKAISRDPAVVEAYLNDPLVHSKATPRFGVEFPQAIEWTQAHAAEMRIPCLIVHGGDDQLVPPEGSRIFYENMTFDDKERQVYEGYYHEVFNDVGKERVLADVEHWVKRHLPQSQ